MMKRQLSAIAAAGALLLAWAPGGLSGSVFEPVARAAPRSTLPGADAAKELLNLTHRHREWLTVSIAEHRSVLAWVVYPERSDRAPVVFLTGEHLRADEWTRAVSDQLAAEGFLVVVPDILTEVDQHGDRHAALPSVALDSAAIEQRFAAVKAAVVALPSAQDTVVRVDVTPERADVQGARPARFDLSAAGWPALIESLDRRTGNRADAVSSAAHADHLAMQAAQRTGTAIRPTGLAAKDPRLPAGFYTARSTLLDSKLKSEWVDIPLEGSSVKLHTFVVYPTSAERTGVVLVMQHGVGLDEWQRAVAVQIAEDGFIAVAPDLWSGTGPNGGNWDASPFIDDAIRAAAGKITPDETMSRYRAARTWALTLPQANGKTGSIGFCAGGGNSFRFAAEVPEHNAAVVFYGTPPSEQDMARINAPVLGFYGENDARVTATVEPTKAAMARLGKQYEAHVYPKVTHSFVLFQDMGNNAAAVADGWPRTVAFYRRYLR